MVLKFAYVVGMHEALGCRVSDVDGYRTAWDARERARGCNIAVGFKDVDNTERKVVASGKTGHRHTTW